MRLKVFSWRYAVYFILAIYLFVDLYACRGPLFRRFLASAKSGEVGILAARVYGRGLTLLELEEAMRDHLWRKGVRWEGLSADSQNQTRWLVLESLVNDHIVRAFRMIEGEGAQLAGSSTTDEQRLFAKQFVQEGDYLGRLALQELGEDDFKTEIKAANEDLAWIEDRISRQVRMVTEAEAKRWYEANKKSLVIPARYRAAHLFLTRHDKKNPNREAEMQEIYGKLISGERKFEEMVVLHSDDVRSKKAGGDLGWFSHERMPKEVVEVLGKLEAGKLSEPVLSHLGWHLLILREKKGQRVPSFEEVKLEILAALQTEMRKAAVKSLIDDLRLKSMKPNRFVEYYPDVIGRAVPAPIPDRGRYGFGA